MSDCCAPPAGSSAEPLTLALLLGTGFLMSLGHCIGMCGPIVAAVSMGQRAAGRGRFRLALASLTYHAGRIAGYGLIGVALGVIGSAAFLPGARAYQGWFSIASGLLMILLGLGLLGILPTRRWVESSRAGRIVAARMRGLLGARSHAGLLLLGFANGFLPCGPVAAAAVSAAATRSPVHGGLSMLAYGLGTIPALVVLGLTAGTLAASVRGRLFRLAAFLVLVMGAQLGLRGLHAIGVIGPMRLGGVVLW